LHKRFVVEDGTRVAAFLPKLFNFLDELLDNVFPETRRIGTPFLKIMPTFRPKVIPSC